MAVIISLLILALAIPLMKSRGNPNESDIVPLLIFAGGLAIIIALFFAHIQ